MNNTAHHEKLDELIENARESMHQMLDRAVTSGALPEHMKSDSTYLLARAVITIYGDQRHHAPPSPSYKRDIKNLSHFI